jgi:hypothetical protein
LKHIDGNVFDDLKNIEILLLNVNPCFGTSLTIFNMRNIHLVILQARENCKPRTDGSSNWKASDDEEFVKEDCGNFSTLLNFMMGFILIFIGIFYVMKKNVSVSEFQERVFYGRF